MLLDQSPTQIHTIPQYSISLVVRDTLITYSSTLKILITPHTALPGQFWGPHHFPHPWISLHRYLHGRCTILNVGVIVHQSSTGSVTSQSLVQSLMQKNTDFGGFIGKEEVILFNKTLQGSYWHVFEGNGILRIGPEAIWRNFSCRPPSSMRAIVGLMGAVVGGSMEMVPTTSYWWAQWQWGVTEGERRQWSWSTWCWLLFGCGSTGLNGPQRQWSTMAGV